MSDSITVLSTEYFNPVPLETNSNGFALSFQGGVNFTQHLTVVLDYDYVSLGTSNQQFTLNYGSTVYHDAEEGGVRVNLLPKKKVVPYLVGEIGHAYLEGADSGFNLKSGFGTSIYLAKGYGIRPEFDLDWSRYGSQSMSTSQGMLSFFWQFGGN